MTTSALSEGIVSKRVDAPYQSDRVDRALSAPSLRP
jgi:ATP-dependent DNA ligase